MKTFSVFFGLLIGAFASLISKAGGATPFESSVLLLLGIIVGIMALERILSDV